MMEGTNTKRHLGTRLFAPLFVFGFLFLCFAFTEKVQAETTVSTFEELKTAVKAGGEIKLGGNITIELSGPLSDAIKVDKNVTIDLNNHNLTGEPEKGLFEVTSNTNLTIKGTGNLVGDYGSYGLILVNGGNCELNITGEIKNINGRGVYVFDGTFSMTSGTITGGNDSGVFVYNKHGGRPKFVMEGGTISGNTASYGGGVYVNQGGTFIMKDGEISGNQATIYSFSGGGGVYVKDGGTFTMEDGEISGNTASYGSGVYVDNGGTFTMSGGTISGNEASKNGGGVYVRKDETSTVTNFTVTNGDIIDNTAVFGGGVYVDGGTFTVTNGKVSENQATHTGGGVYVINNGTFTLSGGAISANKANYNGGGVFAGETITMSGGEISGNTAPNGGGVYVRQKIFNMSDGTISGSTQGVYIHANGTLAMTGGEVSGTDCGIYNEGTFKLSGAPKISKVFLSRNPITITGALSNTGKIVVEKEGEKPWQITTDYSKHNSKAPSTFFSTADENYGVFLENNEAWIKGNSYTLTASIEGWTYGDHPKNPSVSGLPSGVTGSSVVYTYYTDEECKSKTTAEDGAEGVGQKPKFANADNTLYYVKASADAAGGYKAATSAAVAFSIAKRPIRNITGIVPESKVYDGTTEATMSTVNAKAQEVLPGDTLEVNVFGPRFADKNAGKNKSITFEKVELTGASARNYVIRGNVEAVTEADITKKPITVSNVKAKNKTYDGTRDATLDTSEVIFDGVIEGDTVSLSGVGTFAQSNVGTGISVAISGLALGGTDGGNYSLTEIPAATTADITARDISGLALSITPNSFWYDGETKTVSYTLTCGNTVLTSGTDFTEDTSSVKSAKEMGTYTVTLQGMGNYTGTNSASWTINDSVTRSITGTDKTVTYKGEPIDISDMFTIGSALKSVTYSVASGGTGTGTISGSHLTVIRVGKIRISASAVTDDNQTKTATAALTVIEGTETTITGTDKTVTYKGGPIDISDMFSVGSALKSATYSVASGGKGIGTISGSNLTVTRTGKIRITASAVTGDNQTRTATATLTVKKGTGAATISVPGITYGGKVSPTAASTTNSTASRIITYAASGSASTSETAPVAAGTYSATVTYAATDLYSAASATTSFEIKPAVLTIKAENNSKVLGNKDPELTYTATGFKNSDTKDKVLTGKLARAAGDKAGKYSITQGTLAANSNYTISFTAGTFTIVEIKAPAEPKTETPETAPEPVPETVTEPEVLPQEEEEPAPEEPESVVAEEVVDPALTPKILKETGEYTPVERFSEPNYSTLEPKRDNRAALVILIILLCAAGTLAALVGAYFVITKENRNVDRKNK